MIKRNFYLNKIKENVNNGHIKVITGIRRSGKSILLRQLIDELKTNGINEETILFYDLNEYKNRELLDPNKLLEEIKKQTKDLNEKVFLFFDDIQRVEDYEKVLDTIVESQSDHEIFISIPIGYFNSFKSNNLLKRRCAIIFIYPFSYSEFKELYGKIESNSNRELFSTYLNLGGIPFLSQLFFDISNSFRYLKDLFLGIIEVDIIKNCSIRDMNLLEIVLQYIVLHNGEILTAHSIYQYLMDNNIYASVNTISRYLQACGENGIFHFVDVEKENSGIILSQKKKVYLADPGIYNALKGSLSDKDIILKNIVYLELVKRDYNITVGEKYVDFIARKRDQKIYIQVCDLLTERNISRRKIDSLKEIKDDGPKIVLSMMKDNFNRNEIIYENIIDFLLDKTWDKHLA